VAGLRKSSLAAQKQGKAGLFSTQKLGRALGRAEARAPLGKPSAACPTPSAKLLPGTTRHFWQRG